jgi:cysteine synthase A
MPDTMSIERCKLLTALGAKLVLTPGSGGMKGAISKAVEIVETSPNHVMLQQFENPANPEVHRKTAAEEIWEDTGGDVDIFVAGVAEVLKSRKPGLLAVAGGLPGALGGRAGPP